MLSNCYVMLTDESFGRPRHRSTPTTRGTCLRHGSKADTTNAVPRAPTNGKCPVIDSDGALRIPISHRRRLSEATYWVASDTCSPSWPHPHPRQS